MYDKCYDIVMTRITCFLLRIVSLVRTQLCSAIKFGISYILKHIGDQIDLQVDYELEFFTSEYLDYVCTIDIV